MNTLEILDVSWVMYEEVGFYWDFENHKKYDFQSGEITDNVTIRDFKEHIYGKIE